MNKETHTIDQYQEEFQRLLLEKFYLNINHSSTSIYKLKVLARQAYNSGDNLDDFIEKTKIMFSLIERR